MVDRYTEMYQVQHTFKNECLTSGQTQASTIVHTTPQAWGVCSLGLVLGSTRRKFVYAVCTSI